MRKQASKWMELENSVSTDPRTKLLHILLYMRCLVSCLLMLTYDLLQPQTRKFKRGHDGRMSFRQGNRMQVIQKEKLGAVFN